MARLRDLAQPNQALIAGWQIAITAPDAAESPAMLADTLIWQPAEVPGTAAAALAGHADIALLHRRDVWYRAMLPACGQRRLVLHGLATLAELWVGETCLLRSDNMFLAHEVALDLARPTMLHLCFRALHNALARRGGRAAWRPRLAQPPSLRLVRTSLLGQMPGWCPDVPLVGPWRAVELAPASPPPRARLQASLAGSNGIARLQITLPEPADQPPARLHIAGHHAELHWQDDTTAVAELVVPDVAPWWPHTHGTPSLHRASLQLDGAHHDLGAVGFRTLALDRAAGGFTLAVNGTPIFCRGAAWSTANLLAPPCEAAGFDPLLLAARDAGMNMLRIGGTMFYEADAFYDRCAELGILLWQDFMFANFDYPRDEAFLANAATEAAQFLDRTQANPALAILCGGSEVAQQAAMLGLPPARVAHPLFDQILPDAVRTWRPDVPYVPHAPGGDTPGDDSPGGDAGWPFQPNQGAAHYYGVGAYRRPLSDARLSGVRFAAECLALANVPDDRTLEALGTHLAHDPRWKAAVPRDPGAGWDFDDVRDHYLHLLFAVDPASLRSEDPQRYLDLSRAVSAELATALFSEWRRPGSLCAGGLVWQLNDLRPGAGWGVLDQAARPKPIWHALRQVLQPVQLLLCDEGLNGLDVHLLNDTASALAVVLELSCLRDGATSVASARRELVLPARGHRSLSSAELLPGFFDITHAYRFGPPQHDVTLARLIRAEDRAELALGCHFPAGPALPRQEIGLGAELLWNGTAWELELTTARFAQYVDITDPQFRPETAWFHLPPGASRRVLLLPEGAADAVPRGEVRGLNAIRPVQFGLP
jgi:beta-mannosidase